MKVTLHTVSNYNEVMLRKIIDECYRKLSALNSEYPNFTEWYYKNVVPAVMIKEKDIIFVTVDGKIVGISVIKLQEEKKICTLRVDKKYQHNGIGRVLMESSLDVLGTSRPLITVSENRFHEFEKLFRTYGFTKECEYNNYYKNKVCEYAFNGELKKTKEYIHSIFVA